MLNAEHLRHSGLEHNFLLTRNYEVKRGHYHPETSLLFAPWSPAEGSVQVKEFQAKLCAVRVGDQVA